MEWGHPFALASSARGLCRACPCRRKYTLLVMADAVFDVDVVMIDVYARSFNRLLISMTFLIFWKVVMLNAGLSLVKYAAGSTKRRSTRSYWDFKRINLFALRSRNHSTS